MRAWILVLLVGAAPAGAERFGVQVGSVPPAVVGNPASWKMGLDRSANVVQPDGLPALNVPPPTGANVPAPPGSPASLPRASEAAARARVVLDWQVMSAPVSPPAAEFADLCRQFYRLTDAQIARAWRYFEARPDATYPARTANAVLRWLMVEGTPTGGLDPLFHRVADPKTLTTRISCGLRRAPWTSSTRAGEESKVEAGTVLPILGRSGPFFQVEVNGTKGWLPGTHLDLR